MSNFFNPILVVVLLLNLFVLGTSRITSVIRGVAIQGALIGMLPLLLPGVTLTVTPEDLNPFHTFRTMRFDGTRWTLFGDPIAVGR